MIERVASTSPVLHNTNVLSSPSIRQPTHSSISSLSRAQKCWIIRFISRVCASIVECFQALFFTPKSLSTTVLPTEIPNVLQTPEIPQVPQIPITTNDVEKKKKGYAALELSDTEKGKIYFVFHTMAQSKSLWDLYQDDEIKKKGAEIDHVHPYKLLKELSTRKLKPDLQKIKQNRALWFLFIQNLTKSFSRFSNRDLSFYLPDFAREIGCAPSLLEPFLRERNWKNLVLQLLQLQIVES
jgi:hypothetical protein